MNIKWTANVTLAITRKSCKYFSTTKKLSIFSKEFYEMFAEKARWKLCAILNPFWKQHSAKQQLFGHLPPIHQIMQERRAKHAEEEKMNSLRTPTSGHTSIGRLEKTYIHQLCADNEGCLDD